MQPNCKEQKNKRSLNTVTSIKVLDKHHVIMTVTVKQENIKSGDIEPKMIDQGSLFSFDKPNPIVKMPHKELVIKKTLFTEDYSVTKKVLGSGINGKVVICNNRKGEKFALKVLKDSPKARREISLHWRASECEHIVNIIDVYENDYLGKTCLLVVMELMGEELFQRIKSKTSFNEKEASKITRRISLAVKFLHDRNIAHRDLKPENLLYKESGNDSEILKITDFGFAREASNNSGLRSPCYTPYYVAPEILSSQSYGKSCDIWSLGVIIYILISGQPPFYTQNGEPMSPGMKRRIKGGKYNFNHPLWRNVSSSAKQLIHGCLQTDVKRRLNIDQVLGHEWIEQFSEAPANLPTAEMMSAGVEGEKGDYLEDIRDEPQQHQIVKKLKLGSSALMKRRLAKILGHFSKTSPLTKLL